ncbi:hypothetical protein [Streptomyces sp. NPDC059916]|uniref:hypothetical protein n=1 Tax=Streptomyces sp. NPDC059916 TaxID=3347001 RepID=UPI003676FCE1
MTTRPEQLGATPLHATSDRSDDSPNSAGRPFEESIDQLMRDCAALGVGRQVPLRVKVALRRRIHLQSWKRDWLIWLLLGSVVLAGGTFTQWLFWHWLPETRPDPDSLWHFDLTSSNPWQQALSILALAVGVGAALYMALDTFGEDLFSNNPGRTNTGVARLFIARRYALVAQCAEAIHACAQARRGGEQKPAQLKKLAKRLKTVRRGVLDAHHSRGTVARRSHRRKPLKLHERHVSAALVALESKLDHAPSEALRDIAEALLTISDRYCETRLGELLNEEQLNGVVPTRNWDVLRYLTAFVLGAGGVTGLALTGVVPESAEPFVYPIVLMTAFVIAFGRDLRRAIDVFSVITGGP